jgi:nucleoside phosphorylase
MGMPASACLAMKIISHFRPKYLCMAGIAAGVIGAFGDILVADQAWDYGSGKICTTTDQNSEFAPSPNYLQLAPRLKEKVEYFRTHRKVFLSQIHDQWPGDPTSHILSLHIGPMASGAAVLENAAVIQGIVAHNRKLIGVEMEAYSIFLACALAPSPRPLPLIAKSVCDFGTPPKTDVYQRYAAYTSATFIHDFSLDQLAPTIQDSRLFTQPH